MTRLSAQDAACYCITIKGVLDARWSDYFGDLALTQQQDCTILSGPIADQAALFGYLLQLHRLGLPLLRLERVDCHDD